MDIIRLGLRGGVELWWRSRIVVERMWGIRCGGYDIGEIGVEGVGWCAVYGKRLCLVFVMVSG